MNTAYIIGFLLLAIIVTVLIRFMMTTPKYKREEEGFYGGVVKGSGEPDCSRTLPETSEILNILSNKVKLEEGEADLREFKLIMSKLACLKKDLLSPSGIVEATRYQQFETAHDREPVSEITATCLNQTISPRDIDIIFATWRDRGNLLLRKLCTEASLKEQEVKQLEKLFHTAWSDVYDVSKSKCIKTIEPQQKLEDVGAYEPLDMKNLKQYDGYYSGWGGQI
jgi:hypothetical protein